MIFAPILFQINSIGTVGIISGIIFFLVFAALAFVAYKLLRRSVKMAIRMMIVAAILLIAVIGGISLFLFGASSGSGSSGSNRPVPRSNTRSIR